LSGTRLRRRECAHRPTRVRARCVGPWPEIGRGTPPPPHPHLLLGGAAGAAAGLPLLLKVPPQEVCRHLLLVPLPLRPVAARGPPPG